MSLFLERQIANLKRQLLRLGGMVEESVMNGVKAVTELNATLADEVIERDSTIDEHEVFVEEECLKVLALHQPVAIDLRYIAAVMRINRDLERIGDIAVNMARGVKVLSNEVPPPQVPREFTAAAAKARGLLKDSLDALVNLDIRLANEVCERDAEVDAMCATMYDEIIAYLKQNNERLDPLARLLGLPRFVERLGDHAKNIAEDVIYMVEGEIVRHKQAEEGGEVISEQ